MSGFAFHGTKKTSLAGIAQHGLQLPQRLDYNGKPRPVWLAVRYSSASNIPKQKWDEAVAVLVVDLRGLPGCEEYPAEIIRCTVPIPPERIRICPDWPDSAEAAWAASDSIASVR